jgi:hypothetical protein
MFTKRKVMYDSWGLSVVLLHPIIPRASCVWLGINFAKEIGYVS